MSVKEYDPLTGHATTGHEWNGIKELNTRVPRAIWWAIGLTHLWALIIWLLLPAWPTVSTYTTGLLGVDQRIEVEQSVAAARIERSDWISQIEHANVGEILSNPELMSRVSDAAPAIFGDNCAGCHGTAATGGPGFPSLVDNAWLWGSEPDFIEETIRVGINASHPETRFSEMLAFGRDQMLSTAEIRAVARYVAELSVPTLAESNNPEGAEIFAGTCAGCHGEAGSGIVELGAPDLTDDFWIYGGSVDDIFESVWNGRRGIMPSWEERLSGADRKILAAYIVNLRLDSAG